MNKLVAEGDEALRANRLEEAERLYREALGLDPQHVEATYSLGCVASNGGRYAVAVEWADRAAKLDPRDSRPHSLRGNALFGLENYEEAARSLKRALALAPGRNVEAMLGLTYEKLSRLDDAEAHLRSALEDDSSYISRFARLAMHVHSPGFADLHHALARVLQRRGEAKEAWMHYHLARRHDPVIQLDPMYREIVSEVDLENHPYFDRVEFRAPAEDASVIDRGEYLVRMETFDELQRAARKLASDELKELEVGVIKESQSQGHFLVSAYGRLVCDALVGDGDQETFDTVRSASARELFSLAEEVFAKRLEREEALRYATRIAWKESPAALPRFLMRFIAIDPATSLNLAELFAASLPDALPVRADALALVGKTLWRLRRTHEARATLERAAALHEKNGRRDVMAEVLLQLADIDQNDPAAALAWLDRAAGANTELEPVVQYDRARALFILGRFRECVAACRLALAHPSARQYNQLIPNAVRMATDAASHLGEAEQAVARDLARGFAGERQRDEDVDTLASRGEYDQALKVVEPELERALVANDWPSYVGSLFQKARLLVRLDRTSEAREVLEEAANRALPLQAVVNRWPILIALAEVARRISNPEKEVAYLQEALEQARRNASPGEESETHKRLALALVKKQPRLAIDHMDRHMAMGSDQPNDDKAWNAAAEAFKERRYAEARTRFDAITSEEKKKSPRGVSALGNSALASERLGDLDGALRRFEQSAKRWSSIGNHEREVEMLAHAAMVVARKGKNPERLLRRTIAAWRSIKSPGSRRSSGIRLIETARELTQLAQAESVAREVVQLATSEDWRNAGDEMHAHAELGATLRMAGRYREAIDSYETALKIARELNDLPFEARTRGWLAIAHRYDGNIDRAVDEYRNAIALEERYQNWENAAGHRMNLTVALLMVDRLHEALVEGRQAIATFDATGYGALADRVLVQLASSVAKSDLGREEWERLRLLETSGLESSDAIVRSWAEARHAEVLAVSGDARAANEIFARLIDRHRQAGDRYNELVARLKRADAFIEIDPRRARADAEEVTSLIGRFGQERLVVWAHELVLRIALHERNAERTGTALAALLPRWTALRRRLHTDRDRVALAGREAALLDQCAAVFADAGETQRLFEVIECGRAQAFIDLLDTAAPSANVQYATLPVARDLLAAAGRPAILISIAYSGDALIALTLRSHEESPRLHRLEFSRTDVRALLATFDREIYIYRGNASNSWRGAIARMTSPIASRIERDDLVFIVAEEDLQPLPLHAARLSNGELLCAFADVVYAPSVTILDRLRTRPAAEHKRDLRLVGIGVAFQDETLMIMQQYPGSAYTGVQLDKHAIVEAIEDASLVHFSCHGHFDAEDSLESGLILSAREEPLRHDILSTRDLLEARLSAELVTLSACETARGDVAAADFLGLTRAFLAAGARSVLSTLWKVPAPAARQMMQSFYRHLHDASKDRPIDVAKLLRRTQRETIEKDLPIYDWAAFKLVGWPIIAAETNS